MRTVISGATGLIGRELVRRTAKAAVLSRDPGRAQGSLGAVEAYGWEPESGPAPTAALEGTQVVIHLAGESVASGRWTAERKRRIRDSRVLGTRNLVAGIAACGERPRVLISASAVGYYGDRGDEALDESSGPGAGFLAEVCNEWEREAMAAEGLGVRVVCIRTGVVLARGGGALARMLPIFKAGAGGRVASGRQWMSWIHLSDVAGLMLHASSRQDIRGPLNAVAPQPVTNADFTRALARALHRPAFLTVPGIALRAVFGEMGEVFTASQRVLPRVAQATGYAFEQGALDEALAATVGPA